MQAVRKPVLQEPVRFTYEDYCTWDDDERWELIDGIAYAMAAPSYIHQSISSSIHVQIGQFLRGKTCKVFSAPFDVRFNPNSKADTVVQPDIVIICDKSKHDERGGIGVPDMVVEILSPSSVTHDMLRKYGLYLKAGVREYWIVDPWEKIVITHVLQNGKYERKIFEKTDSVPVFILDGCNVDLAEVFDE